MCKDALSRLMRRVNKTETCWLWTGPVNSSGYGGIGFQGKTQGVHRVAYQLLVGPVPQGHHVLHRCDTPRCVNPEHLWTGTSSDNMKDARDKGRAMPFRGAGVKNPRAKLDPEKVEQAKVMRANGALYTVLAKHFGVNSGAIWNAVNGRTWNKED